MTDIQFIKMHGLGNDFVVVDTRESGITFTPDAVRAIANRRTGIGCDQFITIENSLTAHARMGIVNADGSSVAACGNATRCVGQLILGETNDAEVRIETDADTLLAKQCNDQGLPLISVNMGAPRTEWSNIPLNSPTDTLHLPLHFEAATYEGTPETLSDGVAVSMGNPHVVFFVNETESLNLEDIGPIIEHTPAFPERTNVEVVSIIDRSTLRMRVWERGAGITQACGTGACAVLVAAARRGLSNRSATVILDGGPLTIQWADDDTVWMTGPATTAFHGTFVLEDFQKASALQVTS